MKGLLVSLIMLFGVGCVALPPVAETSAPRPVAIGGGGQGEDTMRLYAEGIHELCSGEWMPATWTVRGTGQVIRGCWRVVEDKLHVAFEDGDQGMLPIEALTWAPGKKPLPTHRRM
jgi:hypothetical protein